MGMEPETKCLVGPEEVPVLAVRDTVLFPHAVLPLTVGRESSVQLIHSLGEEKIIGIIAQKDGRTEQPQPQDLYEIGTLALVHKVIRMPNESIFVFAEGIVRIRATAYPQIVPFLRAAIEELPEIQPEP